MRGTTLATTPRHQLEGGPNVNAGMDIGPHTFENVVDFWFLVQNERH